MSKRCIKRTKIEEYTEPKDVPAVRKVASATPPSTTSSTTTAASRSLSVYVNGVNVAFLDIMRQRGHSASYIINTMLNTLRRAWLKHDASKNAHDVSSDVDVPLIHLHVDKEIRV